MGLGLLCGLCCGRNRYLGIEMVSPGCVFVVFRVVLVVGFARMYLP